MILDAGGREIAWSDLMQPTACTVGDELWGRAAPCSPLHLLEVERSSSSTLCRCFPLASLPISLPERGGGAARGGRSYRFFLLSLLLLLLLHSLLGLTLFLHLGFGGSDSLHVQSLEVPHFCRSPSPDLVSFCCWLVKKADEAKENCGISERLVTVWCVSWSKHLMILVERKSKQIYIDLPRKRLDH